MITKKFKESAKRRRRLEEELSRIKRRLIKLGVKKIILFGSFARGIVGRTTDIDLIVVKNTDKPFFDRLTEIYNNAMPQMATDILVYTEEELNDLSEWNVFVRKILKEGKVIYAT